MNASPDQRHGVDVLTLEIREEASRLVHHPVAEVKRLEHVAEEGDSPAALLLLIVGVIAFAVVIGAVAITVAVVAYYS